MNPSPNCPHCGDVIHQELISYIETFHAAVPLESVSSSLESAAFVFLSRIERVRLAFNLIKTAITNAP